MSENIQNGFGINIGVLTDLAYLNPEKTIIQANNTFNGVSSSITIEKDYDTLNLFDRCIAGEFGIINEEYIIYPEEVDTNSIEYKRKHMQISRLQAKAILYEYGLLDVIEEYLLTAPFIIQLAWKEAAVFERNSEIINVVKTEIAWPDGSPLTEEDIDEMFIKGAELSF